jgi:hypothetical protein
MIKQKVRQKKTLSESLSPLSAGSSVLDALWIVAIILEQPAYALIVPSRPIRFWLLILSLQVLPQNKINDRESSKFTFTLARA